jgi:hypothetical protein
VTVGETTAGEPLRIVWPYGEPDDGKWADDVAVQTLRRYDMALAVASYTHDWSSPDLAASTSRQMYEDYYEADLHDARSHPEGVTPTEDDSHGPGGRVIIDVLEQADGAFLVMSCVPVRGMRDLSSGKNPREAEPLLIESLLEIEDGVLKVTDPGYSWTEDPGAGLGGACDGTMAGLRYGYFDPGPADSGVWTVDDLVSPDGVRGDTTPEW